MGPRIKTPGEFAADGLPLLPAVWMRLQAATVFYNPGTDSGNLMILTTSR